MLWFKISGFISVAYNLNVDRLLVKRVHLQLHTRDWPVEIRRSSGLLGSGWRREEAVLMSVSNKSVVSFWPFLCRNQRIRWSYWSLLLKWRIIDRVMVMVISYLYNLYSATSERLVGIPELTQWNHNWTEPSSSVCRKEEREAVSVRLT